MTDYIGKLSDIAMPDGGSACGRDADDKGKK